MRKYSICLISLVIFFAFTPTVFAIETLNISVLNPITQSKMYFNNDLGTINAEVTPWSLGTKITQGGWSTFFISTDQTVMCTTPNNFLTINTDERLVDGGTCHSVTKPALDVSTFNMANKLPLWKRDYNGVFSAHLINNIVYTVNHGESNNNSNSSFPSCSPVADMGYGQLPCDSKYWWGSYNAYVTMSSFPWNKEALVNGPTVTDYGPITWPSNGYIESLDGNKTWIKATDGGVRTPTSIINDGYLYIFYEDTSQGVSSDGRGPGIKIARAPINNDGVDPNSFHSLYNGAFTDASLPAGFNISTYYNSFSQKGGRSSAIFPRELVKLVDPTQGTGRTDKRQVGEVVSFSVAKIAETSEFLGVGYDLSKGVTLRHSNNLIDWSDPIVIPGTESNYWTGVDLQRVPILYPRLANKNGDTSNLIDPNDFYVIGTQTAQKNGVDRKVVNQIHLRLNMSRPGDINGDGSVDVIDTGILIDNYNKKPITNIKADINNDGSVDIIDLGIVIDNYGK